MTAASGHTERCKLSPIKGGTVCNTHGGNLANVRATANVRLARTAAQRQALKRIKDRQGLSSTVQAINEMERLAAEAIVFKDVCRERLEELEQLRYEGKAGEQLRAEVALYERALDRCNTILATCVKLGIAERRQSLDEAEALMLVSVIKNILGALGLSHEQMVIAARVVPEELRALSDEVRALPAAPA